MTAIGALKQHPTPIRSLEEAKSLTGVGEKTAQKVSLNDDAGLDE
jgi:hypothetical protein